MISNSIHAEILESTVMTNAAKEITLEERQSINRVVEYLATDKFQLFMNELKNEESHFCLNFTELIVTIAMKFPIFIIEVSHNQIYI
jgi:hypothetical protein